MLSDDDVIDYMVMEAVAVKVGKEDEAERKKQKREDWKKDTSGLEDMR